MDEEPAEDILAENPEDEELKQRTLAALNDVKTDIVNSTADLVISHFTQQITELTNDLTAAWKKINKLKAQMDINTDNVAENRAMVLNHVHDQPAPAPQQPPPQ